jgi:hypothetical protein
LLGLQLAPHRFSEVVGKGRAAGIGKAGARQQLQGTGKAADDVEHLLQRVLQIHAAERADGAALAQQCLDHQVRALVGGAEHHEARAVALHQPVP